MEDIYTAYEKNPELKHLFLDENVHQSLIKSIPGIRKIVTDAVLNGIAVPGFATSLGYFDNIRSAEMPANLIQAQRDYFGSHTYELKGEEGVFHTEWVLDNTEK